MSDSLLGVGAFDSTGTVSEGGNFLHLFMGDKNIGIDAAITDLSPLITPILT